MPLQFLNQLNESDLITLINYVMEKKLINNNKNLFYLKRAEKLKLFNEPDRCDLEANQEISAHAWNGNYHLGSFNIQDFKMIEYLTGTDFSTELREYMASIFGEDYLNALREFYAIEAEKEIERIKSTLGMGRS